MVCSLYTQKNLNWLKTAKILFILLLLSACGGGSNETDVVKNTSFELTESDFFPPFVSMISAEEFKDRLNSNDDFMADDGGLIEATADEINCLSDKIGDFTASFNQDSGYEFGIKDTNVTDCFTFDEVNLNSVIVSWYVANIEFEHVNGNIADGEVIKFSDRLNYKILKSNARMYMRMTGVVKNVMPEFTFQSIALLTSNKTKLFDEPCLRDPVFTDCVSIEVMSLGDISRPAPELVWKTALTADNLNVVPDKQYYSDGQMSFDFNNWSGVMTYQADGSNAPTYTASDGAETVSGVFEFMEEGGSAPTQKLSLRDAGITSLTGFSGYIYQVIPSIHKIISSIEKQN